MTATSPTAIGVTARRNTYAFRSLLHAGTRLAFGSDAPVADPNPFLGIHAALVRHRPHDAQPSWQPQESLALQEIIYAYTLGAAQATGWDKTIGSLTPGKRADLIVLDRDIFALGQGASTASMRSPLPRLCQPVLMVSLSTNIRRPMADLCAGYSMERY